MSNWFRDFVYIPLGGNRLGPRRTYINLWVVFFLCGLWHGADWTFVAWGMWHGLLLVTERWSKERFGFAPQGISGNLATFLLVLIGWVPFRADSLSQAASFLSRMLCISQPTSFAGVPVSSYITPDVAWGLALAVLFAWLPVERLKTVRLPQVVSTCAQGSVSLLLLLYAAASLSKSAFNPFIYFRF